VVNTAAVRPGQTVVVFGVGGIGLCAVAAAASRGARPIAADDQRTQRLEIAQQLGATDLINAATSDPLSVLKEICPGGWDVAVEATGIPSVMQNALSIVRPRGGTAVVIGNAKFGESLRLEPREFNLGKRLLGTWGGDTVPDRDFPQYCDWIATGLTKVELLLDREYSLAQTTAALEDLHSGRCTRPLINMNSEST